MKRVISFILVLMLISLTLASCLGNETTEKPKTDEELIKARIAAFVDSFDDADSTAFLACFDARTRNTMTASLNLVGGVLGSIDLRDIFTLSFAMVPGGTLAATVTNIELENTSAKVTVDVKVGEYGPYPTYFYMVKEKGDWFITELEDVNPVGSGNGPEGEEPKPYVYDIDSFENGYAYILYSIGNQTWRALINTNGDIVHKSQDDVAYMTYGAGVWCVILNSESEEDRIYELRKADGSLIISSENGAFDEPVCGGDGYVVLYKKEATMTSLTHKLGVIDKNGTWLREMEDVSSVQSVLGESFSVEYRGEGYFSFMGSSSMEIYVNVNTGNMMYFEDVRYITDRFVNGVLFAEYGYKLNDTSEFIDPPDSAELPTRYALYSDGTFYALPEWDLYDENFANHYGSVFVIENDDYFMIFDGKNKEEHYFEYGDINSDLVMGVEFYGEVGVVRIRGLDEKFYYALIDVEGNITKEISEIPGGTNEISYFDGYLIYTDEDYTIHFTSVSDPTKTVQHAYCSILYGFDENGISKICLSSAYLYIKPDGSLLEIKFD